MSPFARWFQARVLRKEAGEAELLLEVREEFLQGQGLVHGGILAALLDSALGQAVESLGAKVVTAELSVSYLRPVSMERTRSPWAMRWPKGVLLANSASVWMGL